jgi:5-hydroxyisourate hydrolase
MAGKLTTHVLDIAHGRPAAGVAVEVWLVNDMGGERTLLKTVRTNSDGRTNEPLLMDSELKEGHYELVFGVGDYYMTQGFESGGPAFLGHVPVRFGVGDPDANYHVPLLASPWAYSTYRGS